MEQINRKADIEALYTLHGSTSVTVRCQIDVVRGTNDMCMNMCCAAVGKLLSC